jgi:general secretion pathway protein G
MVKLELTARHERLAARSGRSSGFTLIELLVVMAILATLLSIVAPRYFESVDRAKEVALRTDLRMLREAIDKHRADRGQFPDSLQRLAELRYLRSVPLDPVTDSALTWTVTAHPDGTTPGVYDVHSGSPETANDGTPYASW